MQEREPSTTSTAAEESKQAPSQLDAMRNFFVDVSTEEVAEGEYSDEEEAQFHAQYQEKHFVQFIEALEDIVAQQEAAWSKAKAAEPEAKTPPKFVPSEEEAKVLNSSLKAAAGQKQQRPTFPQPVITQRNQQMVVEIIRNIAEYAIYSEKFNKNYKDNFIEQNVFKDFTSILSFNNRVVNIQLIQTTSILLQNIKAEEFKYYIHSHPFLNKLISFKFNFYDEELVDTFISFLKALALSIDQTTIKFFMNARTNNFPLLAITCKFFNHGETMVKNAARIIILKIFQLNDAQVNKLLMDLPFCTFFAHLGCYLKDMIVKIDETHNPSALATSSQFPASGKIIFQKPKDQPLGRKSMPMGSFAFGAAAGNPATGGGGGGAAGAQSLGKDSQQPSQANPFLADLQAAAAQAHKVVSPTARRNINFEKLADLVDDLQDAIEFINELFEQCSANKTVNKLLTNAMLHYCYLPVVIPALVGTTKGFNGANISISTALFIVTLTFKQVKSQSLHNALALVLIHDRLPLGFKRLVQTRKPVADPNVSYRFRWMYRLPVHYSKTKFFQEFYSLQCGDTFVREFAQSIKFCRSFETLLAQAQQEAEQLDGDAQPHIYEEESKSMNSARSLEIEVQSSQMHLGVLKEFLTEEELEAVVQYHYQISQGLGHPVGLVNMLYRTPPNENEVAHTQKYPIENLYDRVQTMLAKLLEKTHHMNSSEELYADEDLGAMMAGDPLERQPFAPSIEAAQAWNDQLPQVDTEGKVVENDLKKQFMTFLHAKDDNLLLQTSGCLLTLIMHSKVSQALLYHSQMFPIGINRKSMLLQRLLEAPDSPDKVKRLQSQGQEQLPQHAEASLGSYDSQSSLKERQPSQRSQLSSRSGALDESKMQAMEANFQKFLLQRCQQKVSFYEESLVQSLIRALQPESLTNSILWEESPPFRSLTFRVLSTFLFQLTFNRKCMPSSLESPERASLLRAYRTSCQNLLAAFDVRIARIRPSAQTILSQLNGANQDQVWHERVVQLFNDEFKALKTQLSGQMNDLSDIESLLENPLIMVSAIPTGEEENQSHPSGKGKNQNSKKATSSSSSVSRPRHVPEALRHPTTQTEMLKARIRVFWLLRFLILFLTKYDTELNKTIKTNPMLLDERPVESWQEGQRIKLGCDQAVDSVLCVIRLNQKMVVRYVLLDPEYFILVEVDQEDILAQQKRDQQAMREENKIATVRSQTVVDMRNVNITIHKKVQLRSVESLIDRSEPRNLILGFVHQNSQAPAKGFGNKQPAMGQKKKSILSFNKSNQGSSVQLMPATENLEEMLLYFEHHTKCTYVKNMLDLNKQSLRKRLVTQAKSFLEKCIEELPKADEL